MDTIDQLKIYFKVEQKSPMRGDGCILFDISFYEDRFPTVKEFIGIIKTLINDCGNIGIIPVTNPNEYIVEKRNYGGYYEIEYEYGKFLKGSNYIDRFADSKIIKASVDGGYS